MKTYMSVLGWWNVVGCGLMLGFFNESFGRKMLNEWTRIFAVPYTLNYWSKFWLAWAIGLNVFYGLVNIMAAGWEFLPLMRFIVLMDVIAYALFVGLTVWGILARRTGSGIYSVFVVFGVWLGWGIWALVSSY